MTKTVFDFSYEEEGTSPVEGLRVLPGGPVFSFDACRIENQRKRILVVGAEPGCDIMVEDESVSALHCMIERRENMLLVHDCESKNGTRVNGALVKIGELTMGSLFTVGCTTLVAYGPGDDGNRIVIGATSLQQYLVNAVDAYGSVRSAAAAIGLPYSTLRGWLKKEHGRRARRNLAAGSGSGSEPE